MRKMRLLFLLASRWWHPERTSVWTTEERIRTTKAHPQGDGVIWHRRRSPIYFFFWKPFSPFQQKRFLPYSLCQKIASGELGRNIPKPRRGSLSRPLAKPWTGVQKSEQGCLSEHKPLGPAKSLESWKQGHFQRPCGLSGPVPYLSGGGGRELHWSLRPKTPSNPKMVWLWDLTLEKRKYRSTHLSGSAPRIKMHCCGQALL